MTLIRHISRAMPETAASPELILARWRALSRQVPLMYGLLLVNTVLLAATHFAVAPAYLTLGIPAVLAVASLVRSVLWLRSRNKPIDPSAAAQQLRVVTITGGVLALAFTFWALSLYPYGDAFLRSHIAFYMGVTSIACIMCLMHLRAAALVVGVCVLVPFTTFFALTGEPTFMAIAINMVLVILGLLAVMITNGRDFSALVASRHEMALRQSETQRLLDENYRLANVDGLTGLPNRRSFVRSLGEALARAEVSGTPLAVVRLDMDWFKSVNEIFGQTTGDRVLIEATQRIEALRPANSLLARTGGDSLALLVEGATDELALMQLGDGLCQAMRRTFSLSGTMVRISASAGVAQSRPGDTADVLLDRADYVTQVAKQDKRGKAVLFDNHHCEQIVRVRQMEHLLHTIDLDSEIYILLQPQFDVMSGTTTGFEALARWRSPILGEVSPSEFIPMAERTGQISKVTQCVVRKALAVAETLPHPIRLSVNLSARDVGSATAVEAIVALVEASPHPCRIDFEITETALMHDLHQANRSLLALLGLGARIALDDFGTGHSSLTHVQKLPLHRIKVDRSFVADVTSDPASRAIVKTVLDLCRNLGLSCVFEGIETEDQLHALIGLGGSVMQGYLFGRPMPVENVPRYLSSELDRRATVIRARPMGALG